MGGKPTTSRPATRNRTLRRNAAAALVGHRDSRVPSAALGGSSGAEFVHVARSAFISTEFFEAPTAVFRSPLGLRCSGGKRLEWTADVHRPQLPALRNLPLSAAQLEFLVERMGAEVRGVECDGVTPRQLLRAVRDRFTRFQPTYFRFRPPTIEQGHSSSFFAHIRKLFVPERTFVFLPTGQLQCGVEELRGAVLAVLLVEKDRPLNCVRPLVLISRNDEAASGVADVFPVDEQPDEREEKEEDGMAFSVAPEFDELPDGHSLRRRAAFVLAEPEIRVLLVVKGRLKAAAAGLLRRAARTARRFHALLRRLPTVELSEVVLVADVPPADWNDGEDGELPEGDFERTSGVIGDLRDDRTTAWFAELCGPADTFACETVDRRHRLWFVQRAQGEVEAEEPEDPLELPADEREDEKQLKDEENPWASDQADEHDETAADRAEKPVEDDLWSSDAPPVDLAAELEARLVAAMDAEGIPLPEASDRLEAAGSSKPKEAEGTAASTKPIDQPKSRESSKKADKRKKKRSKQSH
ncbi:hypothetical protein M3Y99_00807000 [Aphelenchoides fujianensis]|nr:hypothetical protein M3Y99_00807000 [Aphelenchoides fujianensis]